MLRIFLRNVAIKTSFVYIISLTLTFYIICAFFLEESNLVAKVRKLVGLRVHFIFSVVLPQNLTQMFSKSAQGDSCKWQICTFSLHSLNRILDCLAYCPLGFHSFMHVKRLKWWRLCRNVYKKKLGFFWKQKLEKAVNQEIQNVFLRLPIFRYCEQFNFVVSLHKKNKLKD